MAARAPVDDPRGLREFADTGPGSADLGRVMAESMERMRAVTIASIHGHCVGGGVLLAMAWQLSHRSPTPSPSRSSCPGSRPGWRCSSESRPPSPRASRPRPARSRLTATSAPPFPAPPSTSRVGVLPARARAASMPVARRADRFGLLRPMTMAKRSRLS